MTVCALHPAFDQLNCTRCRLERMDDRGIKPLSQNAINHHAYQREFAQWREAAVGLSNFCVLTLSTKMTGSRASPATRGRCSFACTAMCRSAVHKHFANQAGWSEHCRAVTRLCSLHHGALPHGLLCDDIAATSSFIGSCCCEGAVTAVVLGSC